MIILDYEYFLFVPIFVDVCQISYAYRTEIEVQVLTLVEES
jgi:hypothetical protein